MHLIDSFEWFASLLINLERKLIEINRLNLVDCKLFLTRLDRLNVAEINKNDKDKCDLFTGLSQKTKLVLSFLLLVKYVCLIFVFLSYGRPNFNEIFHKLTEQKPILSSKVGVFFCGLAQLSSELHAHCNNHSSSKIKFYYNKESF
jgi:hypothetical protein